MSDRDTNCKCPKCGSRTFELEVVSEEGTVSSVVDGMVNFHGQSSLPFAVRAFATCGKCGHGWRLRNPDVKSY